MYFYGSEEFTPGIKARVDEIYNILDDEANKSLRVKKITLLDMMILGLMFNRLHRTDVGRDIKKSESAYQRLIETHKYLQNYIKTLEIYNKTLAKNLSSTEGTNEANEELITMSACVLIRILFFSLENSNAVLKLVDNFTFTDALKLNLDKAFLAANGFPRPRKSKKDSEE